MRWFISVLLVSGIIGFGACKEEPVYQKDQLTGHWAVYSAERNGKQTSLLDGAVFQFQEDGTMNTNITGQERSGPFDLDGNKISFQNENEMVFVIGTLYGDTLSLNAELQGMHFILDLHRTTTEAQ